MIRYTHSFITLLRQQSRLGTLQTVRKFASPVKKAESFVPEKIDENAEDEKQQRERKEKHDQFVKRQLILKGAFESEEDKSKGNFLDMIRIFEDKERHRRNHVEFIYAALKNMDDFGVQKDIEVYKALINVMPKGKFIPTNMWQVEFQHYPKQQQCIIDLLEQMEDNGVIPDYEMEDMLVNIFGRSGHPGEIANYYSSVLNNQYYFFSTKILENDVLDAKIQEFITMASTESTSK